MLRKLVKYMEDHNIQGYGVELPQIAVMGDTSSGKSSLLSAISKIIFPSADGMCTRCPTRLRMERSSGAFKASVRINWHPTSKYGKQHSETAVLHDVSEITKAIEDSQKLIINCSKQSVAKDIIEVNMSGPDYVNVTLVDLPGANLTCYLCMRHAPFVDSNGLLYPSRNCQIRWKRRESKFGWGYRQFTRRFLEE